MNGSVGATRFAGERLSTAGLVIADDGQWSHLRASYLVTSPVADDTAGNCKVRKTHNEKSLTPAGGACRPHNAQIGDRGEKALSSD